MDNLDQLDIAIIENSESESRIIFDLIRKSQYVSSIFSATNGVDLIDKIHSINNTIDILIIDIELKRLNSIEAIKFFKKKNKELIILAWSNDVNERVLYRLIDAGINGFLSANMNHVELENAFRCAYISGSFFSKTLIKEIALSSIKKEDAEFQSKKVRLSSIELTVIELICREKSNKEISLVINRAIRTVEAIKKSIYIKTGTKKTAGVVVYAIKNEIFQVE